jgi:hypothetical protein
MYPFVAIFSRLRSFTFAWAISFARRSTPGTWNHEGSNTFRLYVYAVARIPRFSAWFASSTPSVPPFFSR